MTKKILLADDSITIRKVVGIIFATEDYQLSMVDNGDEAFTMAQSDVPDLIIADIAMPGKDGFELCQAVKSTPQCAGKTAVMLLPGAFDHFDESKAQDVCADGWLTKPFESQALLDKVAQLLEVEPLMLSGIAGASDTDDIVSQDEPSDSLGPVVDSPVATAEGGSDIEDGDTEDIWESVSFDDDLGDDSSVLPETESFAADVFAPDQDADEFIPDFSDEISSDAASEIVADLSSSSLADVASDDVDFSAFDDEVTGSDSTYADSLVIELSDSQSSEPLELMQEEAEEEPLELMQEEAEEEPLELMQEETEEESLELTQDEAEEEPLELTQDEAEEEPLELTQDEAEEEPLGLTQDEAEEEPLELMQEEAEEEPLELMQEEAEEEPLELMQEEAEEEPLELMQEEAEEEPLELTQEEAEEEPLELMQEEAEEEPLELMQEEAEEEPLELMQEEAEEEPLELMQEEAEEEPLELMQEEAEEEPLELMQEETGFVSDGYEGEVLDLSEDDVVDETLEEEPLEVALSEEDSVSESISSVDFEPTPETELLSSSVDSEDLVDENAAFESAVENDVDTVFASTEEDIVLDVEEEETDSSAADSDFAVIDSVVDAETDDYSESAAEPEPVAVASVVPAASIPTSDVESQLRALSDDELKDIVSRVAGPLIESMAKDMVEKIVWEVVPDLAEVMIRDEIRKITDNSE